MNVSRLEYALQPLREEMDRLYKENDDLRRQLAEREQAKAWKDCRDDPPGHRNPVAITTHDGHYGLAFAFTCHLPMGEKVAWVQYDTAEIITVPDKWRELEN